MFTKILVPTDGSELADKAVEQAIAIAKLAGSSLTLLRVTAPPAPIVVEGVVVGYPQEEVMQKVRSRVGEHLAALEAKAAAAGVAVTHLHIEHDQPWRAIVDSAGKIGASLIVMASHGRRGLSALVIGSETQKVLTHTEIPVLVCR